MYEKAFEIALREAGFEVGRQVAIPVWFRGHQIGDFYADLVVNGLVILELKASRELDSSHEAQLLNYLRASTVEIGLIVNFGPKPQIKRLIFDNERKRRREVPETPV